MDTLDLARWQFAITTVYHFFFVPVTISLVAITAGLQTAWYRTGKEKYLRLTKFYGKLFLINIAMGVVTGLVQEFQFGMNWSDYSRFVGDVFGAPLALEGLLAFFLESTFIGLWIFGWDRLPKLVHLACIWMVVLGTQLSAYFILAANSWMQNPVGFRYNADRGRAELTDLWAVLTNKVVLVTYPHTIFAAFMVGGAFVAGVALWHLVRRPDVDTGRVPDGAEARRRRSCIVAGAGVAFSGDLQGKVMTEVQPMKMAAAEALYETEKPASFSVFTVGTLDGSQGDLLGQGAVPAVVPGHRALRRRGEGDQLAAGRLRAALRAGLVQAEHPADLLDLPADDRGRDGVRGDRAVVALGNAPGPGAGPVAGLAGDRRCRCCRWPRTPSAGSSPRPGGSPGWCSDCCRRHRVCHRGRRAAR